MCNETEVFVKCDGDLRLEVVGEGSGWKDEGYRWGRFRICEQRIWWAKWKCSCSPIF